MWHGAGCLTIRAVEKAARSGVPAVNVLPVPERQLSGRCLVPGHAAGRLLLSDVPLSFMGGVDPSTGVVIDTHHPLHGATVTGTILAIPSGRGSCSGSGALFEMVHAGTAPAALIFKHHESILTLGVLIAGELLGRRLPVVQLTPAGFDELRGFPDRLSVAGAVVAPDGCGLPPPPPDPRPDPDTTGLALTERDRQMLAGAHGEAARLAMRIVVQAALLEGASELVDVAMAHIDGVFYQGAGSLAFATTLRDLGGRVRVPTSMNALCVDRRRWRRQGVPAELGEPSERLADAYVQMGVSPTYTCAPYCLSRRPEPGQQIAWAESNAVVYANSVLGARTMKYPDYLDILVAIAGRAPLAGPHAAAGRRATVQIDVAGVSEPDDAFFATLGYHVGRLAPQDIPVVAGLGAVSPDDLKTFGAAFATTSAAPMFHVVGATPEAPTVEHALAGTTPRQRFTVRSADLAATWRELDDADDPRVDLVSLGSPHLSLSEFRRLAGLLDGRTIAPGVDLVVTCGREVHDRAAALGYVGQVERFGGTVVRDACWCFLTEPVVPPGTGTILTNSGKYAHYGPAVVDRRFHLRGLAECVDAACTGAVAATPPAWLRQHGRG